MPAFGGVGLDVRYALRGFRRTPLFTAVVMVTLVAGIAAVTTIFSYMNAVYFADLPYHEAKRTVNPGERWARVGYASSAHAVQLLRGPTASFERVSVYEQDVASLAVDGVARQVRVLAVDTGFAAIFALRPAAGRLLSAEEIRGNVPVAMISVTLWEARFGGDTSAIGKYLSVRGREHRITGVLPHGFRFPYQTDVVVPLDEQELSSRAAVQRVANDQEYFVIARLRNGVTHDQAATEVGLLDTRLPRPAGGRQSALIMHPEVLERNGRAFLPFPAIFVGAGLFVLLIASANVANLFRARGAERRAEVAIRASLGAARWRLVRQALTEALLLGGTAAVIGTLLSPVMVRVGLTLVPTQGFPSWFRVTTDYRVALFALGVLLLVTLVVGLSPALEGTRLDLVRSLKAGGEGSAVTTRFMRNSGHSLVLQLALGVSLLVCSALMARSYLAITRVDLGYPAERIAVIQPFFDPARYSDADQRARFMDNLAREMRANAQVAAVATRGVFAGFSHLPADTRPRYDPRLVPDGDSTRAVRVGIPGPAQWVVSEDYFGMLELGLREGRLLDASDAPGSAPVSVISASAAQALWPGASAVGRTIQVGAASQPSTVVGVVDDVHDLRGGRSGLSNAPLPTLYYSARQARAAQHMLLARGAGNVRTLRTFMAGRVAAADPQLVVSRDETLASQVDHQLLGTRVFGGMIGTFAMVALVLAVIGTYGVVAFGVASRTREIGIRMALGGSHAAVLRHVMGSTLAYVAVGMLVGLALGYLLARLLRVFLFGVSALDPLAYAVVCVILAVVAAVACWLPARRATRVDPLIALRAD